MWVLDLQMKICLSMIGIFVERGGVQQRSTQGSCPPLCELEIPSAAHRILKRTFSLSDAVFQILKHIFKTQNHVGQMKILQVLPPQDATLMAGTCCVREGGGVRLDHTRVWLLRIKIGYEQFQYKLTACSRLHSSEGAGKQDANPGRSYQDQPLPHSASASVHKGHSLALSHCRPHHHTLDLHQIWALMA